MHRTGEDVWSVGENSGRAVALMNIAVQDQDGPHRALVYKAGRAVGQIVENTVTGAVGEMGMVCATGRMAGKPEAQRLTRRQQSAVHRQKRTVGEHLAPFQAKRAQGVGIKRPVGDRIDIGPVLRTHQVGAARRFRLQAGEMAVDPVLGKPPHQGRKFCRRKPVPLGQRDVVIGVGDKRQHRTQDNSGRARRIDRM